MLSLLLVFNYTFKNLGFETGYLRLKKECNKKNKQIYLASGNLKCKKEISVPKISVLKRLKR